MLAIRDALNEDSWGKALDAYVGHHAQALADLRREQAKPGIVDQEVDDLTAVLGAVVKVAKADGTSE